MFKKYALLATLLVTTSANAMPLPHQARSASFAPSIAAPVAGQVDFTAIVALDDCSGSLVRFTTSLGSDSAMVLTNGHCFEGGFLNPGEVRVNVPSSRTFELLSSDGQSTLTTLTAKLVLYATMTRTDVTLYQIQNTYDEIEKAYGVKALTLSTTHPEAGTPIAIPSGYWKKIYSCSIDRFIYELHEGGWVFSDSIRYLQPGCEIIGGTSGSPIVNTATHEMIGINNTSNEDNEQCTLDNPCEVDEQGKITVIHNASYGQEVYWFYACLDSQNAIDLNLPGCALPKPQPPQSSR